MLRALVQRSGGPLPEFPPDGEYAMERHESARDVDKEELVKEAERSAERHKESNGDQESTPERDKDRDQDR
jgi:hypothetical protein